MVEVSQYIKFGELSSVETSQVIDLDTGANSPVLPRLEFNKLPDGTEPGSEESLTQEEEDAILQNTAGNFADWVAAFLRRVILLFENLPEEGANGSAGGQTEGR